MELVTFELSALQKAFVECQLQYPHMQRHTRLAHEIVFDKDNKYERRVKKAMLKLRNGYDVLPVESAIGKLEKKIHNMIKTKDWPADMNLFDRAMTVHTMAALYVGVGTNSGLWKEEVEVKIYEDPKRPGKTLRRSHTNLIMNGTPQPHNYLRGYEEEPGVVRSEYVGYERLTDDQIAMDAEQASIPFEVWEGCSPQLLEHFYHASVLYHAPTKNEKRTKRRRRFDVDLMNAVKQLIDRGVFYLPVNHCSRMRTYYDANALYGLRPQGKLFETSMIVAAKARVLGKSAIRVAKHVIVANRYGEKLTEAEACRKWSEKDLTWAKNLDPFITLTDEKYSENTHHIFKGQEDEMGVIVQCLQMAEVIEKTRAGEPTKIMVGEDLTNSGLLMLANSSRSPKMLRSVNMMSDDTVQDAYKDWGIAHGIWEHLGRKIVKGLLTPLLHGASPHSLVRNLHTYVPNPEDFTVESMEEHNLEAYGPEVDNIEMIAEWGIEMVDNFHNVLKWKTPDGLTCTHQAVMDRTPFSVFVASTRGTKRPYKEYKIMSTMPVAFDRKKRPVFGRENITSKSHKGVCVKTRGLFANITHSIDGYLLRRVTRRLLDAGQPFLVKHDDYIVPPDQFGMVIEECQDFFDYLQNNNLYQSALDQIAKYRKVPGTAPKLVVGSAENRTKDSINFLMP
jgi:hypothetical protein